MLGAVLAVEDALASNGPHIELLRSLDLKNQGYGFEHNFGHGKRYLATVFAQLMMLAFLIDQAQQRCCALFRAAREKAGRSKYLWERLRGLFLEFFVSDWETLYRAIAFGHRTELVPFDTS